MSHLTDATGIDTDSIRRGDFEAIARAVESLRFFQEQFEHRARLRLLSKMPQGVDVGERIVFTDLTQTLTNKTLTSPTITGPVLDLPQINDTSDDHQYIFAVNELAADRTITLPLLTGNDTFVFEAHAATLTNKTVNLASNTLTGTTAQFNTALSDGSFATLAGTETLTNKALTSPVINTLLSGSANLQLTGGGPHSLGIAASNVIALRVQPTFTSDGSSTIVEGFRLAPALTGAAGDTGYQALAVIGGVGLGGRVTTAGNTEVIASIASLRLTEPNITLGTGDTVTLAATLYIASAPTEGTTNDALHVASGSSRFKGTTFVAAGTAALPSLAQDGDSNTGRWAPAADTLAWSTGGVERMRLNDEGPLKLTVVSDAITSPQPPIGLVIEADTVGNAGQFIQFQVPGYNHGRTSLWEDDAAVVMRMNTAGLHVNGIGQVGSNHGVTLGSTADTPDTATSTSAIGVMFLSADKYDAGTSVQALGSTENMMTLRSSGATQFIWKGGGNSWQNGLPTFGGNTLVTAAPTYTPTNVTTDRSYDANATTVAELADVLGTLLQDLQAYGLLQ